MQISDVILGRALITVTHVGVSEGYRDRGGSRGTTYAVVAVATAAAAAAAAADRRCRRCRRVVVVVVVVVNFVVVSLLCRSVPHQNSRKSDLLMVALDKSNTV
ncbi:hypothetical protein V1478_014699 [Vespula squamosa]|uniref:Uncharacterized protein n=1 Tax=Vespula squamosa TaxID=30214 RepID=A0ABD2A309_VESSQ